MDDCEFLDVQVETLTDTCTPEVGARDASPRHYPAQMDELEVRHESATLRFRQRCIRACLADMASEVSVSYSALASPLGLGGPRATAPEDTVIFSQAANVTSADSVWPDAYVLHRVAEASRGAAPRTTMEPVSMSGPSSRAINTVAASAIAVAVNTVTQQHSAYSMPNPYTKANYRSHSIPQYAHDPSKGASNAHLDAIRNTLPITRAVAEAFYIANSTTYDGHLNKSLERQPSTNTSSSVQLTNTPSSPFRQHQYIPRTTNTYLVPPLVGPAKEVTTVHTCGCCVYGEPVHYYST